MPRKRDIDDYYTEAEKLPNDAHTLAAYGAVKDAFEELDSVNKNKDEVIGAHQHLENAVEILENTDIVE